MNQYRVIMEADPGDSTSAAALKDTYVAGRTPAGVPTIVPLAAFAHYEMRRTSLSVNHQGLSAATTISFGLPAKVSMSQATAAIERSLAKIGAPDTIRGSFQGQAKVFQESLNTEPLLVLTALVAVYIVLGMLYESYIHPLTILSTLPSAGVGALLALLATHTQFSIIALIGVILLIGIVKKNAIMMIDYAIALRRLHGTPPREAIFEACRKRFRPIMMTTMAALFGALPLALRARRRRGVAPAARHFHRGRPGLQPAVDLVHDAADLSLSRSLPGVEPGPAPRPAPRSRTATLGSNDMNHALSIPRRLLAAAAAFIAALIASGCAVGPDYVRPTVDTPAQFKEAHRWAKARPGDALPRGAWWTVYGDAVLDALMRRLNVSNQTIAQAAAQYRYSQALVGAARAAYFPSLNAAASATRSHGGAARGTVQGAQTAPGTATLDSAAIDATWEIDLWGRLRRETESARANFRASAADLASAALSAQAALALDYFQLRITDEERRLYDANVADLQRSLRITRNQLAAGVAAQADVAQAQTQLKSTQAAAIDLAIQRAQLEHGIAVLIGKAPADFSLAAAPLTIGIPLIPSALPSELLERRPDIAAEERRVAAANANIGVAESAYFPQATLSGTVGFQGANWSGLLSAANEFWSVGPALALNLFDGGARRAATAEARANYDASVAVYRATVLTAFQQVEDNLVALRELAAESAVQDDATKAADQAATIALNQYKSGLVSYLGVVVAQSTALANERASIALRGRQLAASVELIKSLGGGWNQPAAPR